MIWRSMKPSAALALIMLTVLLASLARAGELPPNFRTLEAVAEQGDPDAQFLIGRHFFQHQADDPDAAEQARDWLTRSARQDHAHAMLLLGQLLELANVGEARESVRWYARAAELGLAEAQLRLGNYYFQGRAGLPQDCAEALSWYEQALARRSEAAGTNIVWLLATCPDAEVRDGSRALRLAMDIVYTEGRNAPNDLDNLAAAFAEVGDFRSAWETQEDALEQLPANHPSAAAMREHLAAYRQRRPWREVPAEP